MGGAKYSLPLDVNQRYLFLLVHAGKTRVNGEANPVREEAGRVNRR